MVITNIDITGAERYLDMSQLPTATVKLLLTSQDDYDNLRNLLGKNVIITEVNERIYQYISNTTSGGIGDTKNERILKPGPEAIPVRKISSAIKELDINESIF